MMKYEKIAKFTGIFLFLFFFFIYIVGSSGFYEYKLNEKKVLTEEKIKQFESDVNHGVEIDIQNYIEDGNKNYDNVFSKMNRKISSYISRGFEETFKYLFRYIDANS